MLDFLVGLDTEFSDMVDGSHLYFPSAVQLEDVVLPTDQKKLIVETVENFAAYKKVRKTLGLDKTGLCLTASCQTGHSRRADTSGHFCSSSLSSSSALTRKTARRQGLTRQVCA